MHQLHQPVELTDHLQILAGFVASYFGLVSCDIRVIYPANFNAVVLGDLLEPRAFIAQICKRIVDQMIHRAVNGHYFVITF
ncbi:hypothetical protein NTG1052_390023 [Candidatus Nitrotoga sp. 1052]|nr:hypothetical protein NTG1052_390023 [Candidatus Nitrotoga sp. 1052]